MLIYKRIRRHDRVPAFDRAVDSHKAIQPIPLQSVTRLRVTDTIALVHVGPIVEAAAVAIPHSIAAILFEDARSRIRFASEVIMDADYIRLVPGQSVGGFGILYLIQRLWFPVHGNKAGGGGIPQLPLVIVEQSER